MIRKIVKIDTDKCDGCGLCAHACHEDAIAIQNGKAVLIRDDYCDGLGNCLPVCPKGAIGFEEREAAAFDEAAVAQNQRLKDQASKGKCSSHACPGSAARAINTHTATAPVEAVGAVQSNLMQWPVQIKLVPVNAPYFEQANLLIAADCTAYAYGDFHTKFMKNRVTLIGCPKLDEGDYSEKLTAILQQNNIRSVKVVRMEVPCCGGIERAVVTALQNSGKVLPWQVITVSCDGKILDE
ncbi:MAG: 4Fe-4S binding protein [Oscillospiraceae bacterium]|nr:4Fe-4S binding protein [Oscillospiraceae bacterium]